MDDRASARCPKPTRGRRAAALELSAPEPARDIGIYSIAEHTRTDVHDPVGNTRGLDTENALHLAAFRLGQLAARGGVDQDVIWAHLTDAALDVGLGEAETRRTIASGWHAGLRRPRT